MDALARRSTVQLTLSAALVLFLVRSWLDWRFVYGEFIPESDTTTLALALGFYVVVVAAWLWALVAVERDRRGGLLAAIALAGLLLVLGGIFTALSLCPCEAPFMNLANWAGVLVGAASVASAWARMRAGAAA